MSTTEVNLNELPREELFSGGHGACAGCGPTIAIRQALKVLGKRTVIVIPASCAATVGANNLDTAWCVPFVHSLFECAPAVASGLRAAFDVRGIENVNVISWAGDAGSADIGFQSLSAAAERNDDIIHVCYDNEVAMNTGGQAGAGTPSGARTLTTPVGKPTAKKDMPAIMLAHHIPYVATASIAYPEDFMAKLKKAAGMSGFRYLHVIAPCPPGWGYQPHRTVEMARLAVETGLWPLFEAVDGKVQLTLWPKERKPLADYLKAQSRFTSLDEVEHERIEAKCEDTWCAYTVAGGDKE